MLYTVRDRYHICVIRFYTAAAISCPLYWNEYVCMIVCAHWLKYRWISSWQHAWSTYMLPIEMLTTGWDIQRYFHQCVRASITVYVCSLMHHCASFFQSLVVWIPWLRAFLGTYYYWLIDQQHAYGQCFSVWTIVWKKTWSGD